MLQSHVELVATTDDPADSLEYHKEIAKEKNFPVRVVPSFRTGRGAEHLPRELSRLRLAPRRGVQF